MDRISFVCADIKKCVSFLTNYEKSKSKPTVVTLGESPSSANYFMFLETLLSPIYEQNINSVDFDYNIPYCVIKVSK